MAHQKLHVDGMTCDHCVETIQSALRKVKGVQNIEIDLEGKSLSIDFDEFKVQLNTINNIIHEVGFEVLNQP